MSNHLDKGSPQTAPPSMNMNEYLERFRLRENGGRRLGLDRRQHEYTLYIPERRSGYDRRIGGDRRKAPRLGSRLTSRG